MSNRETETIEIEGSHESDHTETDNDLQVTDLTSSDDGDEVNEVGDELYAGMGDDLQDENDGDDALLGEQGDDTWIAGLGNDHIDGGEGDDDIEGNEGDDELHAGIGDDHLDGGEGDDTLFGDDGDDVLRAGFGNDVLTGGAGLDDFTFYATGDFKVTDYSMSDDQLVFDSAKTGLHNLEDLLRVITNMSDTAEGVVIEFGQVASITLIGLTTADLNAEMVHFA